MKAKENAPAAGGQVTFVHNPSSAPSQQSPGPASNNASGGAWGKSSPAPSSNVSAGSAWAKPLVYQPPGKSYSGAAPGNQESGTVSFLVSFFCSHLSLARPWVMHADDPSLNPSGAEFFLAYFVCVWVHLYLVRTNEELL